MQNSFNTIHLRNMVCFSYIIVNTLHKGDNNDDDDDDDNDDNNNNNENNKCSVDFANKISVQELERNRTYWTGRK
jgi:hypothetical protein